MTLNAEAFAKALAAGIAAYEAVVVNNSDDWIEWGGGLCPLLNGDNCEVRMRGGEIMHPAQPYNLAWDHDGADKDIIFYRLAK